MQQQAGPGGVSGLSLASLPPNTRNRAQAGVGDIAARLTELLGAGPGALRNVNLPVGQARLVAGAESQAMRNAEMGRNIFERATSGAFLSAAIGTSNIINEQVVSDAVRLEAINRRKRPLGPLAYPTAAPKPVPNRDSFKCPACGNVQQQLAKSVRHREWERH